MNRDVHEITSRGQWLALRQRDITASRIGALFDCHSFLTREGLCAGLRGENVAFDNAAMRAGRILEPAVAAAVAEEKPDWQITKATTYHRLPDHRLGCTPDFFVGDDGLIQAKTVSPQEWEKWGCKVPFFYTLQTLTELLVTGREWGVLAVLVRSPSFPLYLFDVPRHAAAEERILGAVADFWRAYDAGEFPRAAPVDGLAEAFDDGSHCDLSADNSLPELLFERERLKGSISHDEKRVEEIDEEIKAKVGAARTGWLPGWLISYATQHRKETIIPAKDIRVLRIKRSDEA